MLKPIKPIKAVPFRTFKGQTHPARALALRLPGIKQLMKSRERYAGSAYGRALDGVAYDLMGAKPLNQ